MLVSDFKVNSRLKDAQRYFCGMHVIYFNEDAKKKKGTFCTLRAGIFKPLLAPNFSISSS